MKRTRLLGVFGVLLAFMAAAALVASRARPKPVMTTPRDLVVASTTDTAVFAPVIEDFRRLNPFINIDYRLMDAEPLYHEYISKAEAGQPMADVLLSTSMDLQIKLVNDGYATPHVSENGRAIPKWARWRNEAFGISFEPVVMVFNKHLMQGRTIPRSRSDLLADIRSDPEFWRQRVGTYDIARSGLGYLLASQDARLNSDAGVLVDAFGDVEVFVNENSATLLEAIEDGRLAMGYNILGSYARRRSDAGAPITIVYPQDYTLAVSRTAIIPRNASNLEDAHVFLEYLLSVRGQEILTRQSRLSAVRTEIGGPYQDLGAIGGQVGLLKPIALGPGLLVYLDERKNAAMIESWNSALAAPRRGGAPE